ncbi:MAG: hypothetical protein SVY53_05120 [Chloroflexota bacterium]|nr:hypothetical protein [Chloroflexota bacterium]
MKMEFNVKMLKDVVKGGLIYHDQDFYIKGETDDRVVTCYNLTTQSTWCIRKDSVKVIDTGLVVGKLDKEGK